MEINKATLELTPKGNCRATRFSKSPWYNTLNGFWETITILTFSKDLHLNFQLLVHRLPEPREITIPSTYHCSRFIIHIIVFEWQTIIQHQLLPTNEKTTTITTRYKWLFYFLHHISTHLVRLDPGIWLRWCIDQICHSTSSIRHQHIAPSHSGGSEWMAFESEECNL